MFAIGCGAILLILAIITVALERFFWYKLNGSTDVKRLVKMKLRPFETAAAAGIIIFVIITMLFIIDLAASWKRGR